MHSELTKSLKEYNCKLERIFRFLYPEISLDYLQNNVDLIERSIYSNSGRLKGSNDSKNQIIIPEQEKRKGREKNSELKLRKDLSTSFVSTADSSFLKFLQNSQHSRDFNDHFKEQEQFKELISDEMIEKAISYLPSDLETFHLVEVFLKVCETNYFYVHPRNFLRLLEIYLHEKSQKNMFYLKQNWFFFDYLVWCTCYLLWI